MNARVGPRPASTVDSGGATAFPLGALVGVRSALLAATLCLWAAGALAQESDALDPYEERVEPRSSVGPEEFGHMAGTRGDPMRALQGMPGVTPSIDGEGLGSVHGHGLPDVRTHLFGLELPIPFHQTGQQSVLPPDWVERVDLYPGPPVRYGDLGGAAIDVTLRLPAEDAPRVAGSLDTLSMTAQAETPLARGRGGRATTVGVAVRRSLADLWGRTGVGREAPASLIEAPVYGLLVPPSARPTFEDPPVSWDYLLLAHRRLGPREDVRIVIHGSMDSVALHIDGPADTDPALSGVARRLASFHSALARWERAFPAGTTSVLTVSVGSLSDSFALRPAVEVEHSRVEIEVREELRFRIDPLFALEAGLDLLGRQSDMRLRGPPPPEEGAVPVPVTLGPSLEGDRTALSLEPSGWVATPLLVTRRWLVTPGVRIDYAGTLERVSVDPRFHSRALVAPGTTVRGLLGLFSRAPTLHRTMPSVGTAGLTHERVAQVGIGLDQAIHPVVLSVDGTLHVLSNRAVAVADGSRRGTRYASVGGGTVRGAEASLRLPPSRDGWIRLSYGLSSSDRRDATGPARPFSGERTHSVSAVGSYVLGDGWEAGARFRVASGTPTTEIVGADYDADADAYRPRPGPLGEDRLRPFHQLDLRIDKRWTWRRGSLAIFVDVQNAYDADNVVGRVCSFDYRECIDVEGMSVLPTAGIEGRF